MNQFKTKEMVFVHFYEYKFGYNKCCFQNNPISLPRGFDAINILLPNLV